MFFQSTVHVFAGFSKVTGGFGSSSSSLQAEQTCDLVADTISSAVDLAVAAAIHKTLFIIACVPIKRVTLYQLKLTLCLHNHWPFREGLKKKR